MVEYQKKHILLTGTQAEWLARRAETDGRTEAETLRAIIDAERSRDDPRIPLGLDADGSPVHWDWRNTDLRLDRESVHVLDRTLARILASGSPLIVFNPTKTLDIQPLADDPSLPDPIIHSGRADMKDSARRLERMLLFRQSNAARPLPFTDPIRPLFVAVDENGLPEETRNRLSVARFRREAGIRFITVASDTEPAMKGITRLIAGGMPKTWQTWAEQPWPGPAGEDHAWLFGQGAPRRLRITRHIPGDDSRGTEDDA